MNLPKLKGNKVIKFIGSIKVAFALFLIIILVSMIGAVVPEQYRTSVYYSWWFFILLFLFGTNLAVCTVGRLISFSKRWGSNITHVSILIILVGSLISFFSSVRGTIEFQEGQMVDSFVSDKGLVSLNFKVMLQDFHLEWYSPQQFKIKFYVQDKNIRGYHQVVAQKEYRIKGTDYSFSLLQYFPDFAMDESNKAINVSPSPHNPAVLLAINSPKGKEERWVFAKHQETHFGKDQNIKFLFDWEPMIKEFRSTVKFIDGQIQTVRSIKVNSPAEFKGYTFYQLGYDEKRPDWTTLEVVKDPGVTLVFVGFILLNLGIILVFLQKVIANKRKAGKD